MAAGLGTRMQPFSSSVAKPLLPVMGVPTIQFVFDLLRRFFVNEAAMNVHAHAENSAQAVRFLEPPKKLHISDESERLLGSAGGMRKCLNFFQNEPFFYLNSDQLLDINLRDLGQAHLRLKKNFGVQITLAILSESPNGTAYREILVDRKRGLIRGLGGIRGKCPVFCGAAVIEPELLANLPPETPLDFVPTLLEPAIRRGKAGVFWIDQLPELGDVRWIDMGTPELWRNAHFQLIDKLESGDIPTPWKDRILRHNRSIAPGIWISNWSALQKPPENWEAPVYYSPEKISSSYPGQFGPRSVLYGNLPEEFMGASADGIFFRGLSSFSSSKP